MTFKDQSIKNKTVNILFVVEILISNWTSCYIKNSSIIRAKKQKRQQLMHKIISIYDKD